MCISVVINLLYYIHCLSDSLYLTFGSLLVANLESNYFAALTRYNTGEDSVSSNNIKLAFTRHDDTSPVFFFNGNTSITVIKHLTV
jgi:hypothetical protein